MEFNDIFVFLESQWKTLVLVGQIKGQFCTLPSHSEERYAICYLIPPPGPLCKSFFGGGGGRVLQDSVFLTRASDDFYYLTCLENSRVDKP